MILLLKRFQSFTYLPARSIYFKGLKQTLSVNSCLLITGRGDVDFYIIIILCAFRYV